MKLFSLIKNMDTATGFRCSRDGHCILSFEYLTHLVDLDTPRVFSESLIILFQFSGLIILHWHLFGPHIENSSEKLPNPVSALGINCRSFYLLNVS